jgi:TatD family-associated radical SAM protein
LKDKVDTVSISLNASNAAAYQEICKSEFGEKAFDALLEFASKAKEYVPSVILSVVDVLPKEELERCADVANKVGVRLRIREIIE